ncbi:MAG: type II toxin-antitoxin system Phd/YefM family antitoxin [Blastocatellia bacterium]
MPNYKHFAPPGLKTRSPTKSCRARKTKPLQKSGAWPVFIFKDYRLLKLLYALHRKQALALSGQGQIKSRHMNTHTIDISQITPPIGELLKLLIDGSEIVLSEDGKPVARLLPVETSDTNTTPRIAGLHDGEGWIGDDFDAPLPDDFWNGRV